ncbi:hypothetical protein PENSPDRAFT_670009 [Peniophora sp. CONT]|nr:hypothetical protein PENSPDRAFT_670009 [Peniophora sp. CONT]
MSFSGPAAADASSGSNVGYFVTSILSEHENLRAENADLRAQLAVARQHADPVASATIADLQQRYDREREHHAATRKSLNAMREAWDEFDRHSAVLDSRLHDARKEVARVMGESAGYAHFQQPPSPMVLAGAAARMAGPARTLPAFPGMPVTLPPAPATMPTRRHRADSNDERPAKRHRADGPRHAVDSSISRPSQYLTGPGADRGYLATLGPSFAFASARPQASSVSPKQNGVVDAHGRPRSRATTPTRSRSRSLSVENMLLDAAGESPLLQPAATAAPGPMQQYQTHVFQPPVTGPPVKRTQTRPVDKAATLGDPMTSPNGRGSIILPPGGFPATNDKGQRICRQCGLAGRYKDGKCVEKWGPGPSGPGTVCDRCRKKMKRVERRGTMDPAALGPHNVSPPPAHEREPERVSAAATLPARLPPAPAPDFTRVSPLLVAHHAHPPIATLSGSPPPRPRPDSASSHSHISTHSHPQPRAPARTRSFSDAENEIDVDAEADDDDDLANDLLAAVDASEGPAGWAVKREAIEV